MKIRKTQLKRIIKEEVEKVVKEDLSKLDPEYGSGLYQRAKGKEEDILDAIERGENWRQISKLSNVYDDDYDFYLHLKRRAKKKRRDLSEDASLLSPRLEVLFGEGAPGHNFAEALATTLMLDEESDFQAMVQAIKDGLENWYQSRRM